MCFNVVPILACPVFHDHLTITTGGATALYYGRDGIQSAFDHVVAAVGLSLREGMIELRPKPNLEEYPSSASRLPSTCW